MRAVVVALGKVGLPLAAKLTLSDHEVVGCDSDPRVCETVAAGRAPFPGESGLDAALTRAVGHNLLRTTGDTATAIAAHRPALIVAVPPLYVDDDAQPAWETLDAVCADIARGLRDGLDARREHQDNPPVVAIETTVPVGSTRERVAPALAAGSGGLIDGVDFHTVFSPERVFSGRALADLDAYPKLVGGLTAHGERRAIACYREFLKAEVRGLGSAEAAELAKLAETTYRDINIAYANELAIYSERLGVDVLEVIDAANSQPYSHIHRPGIAVGGHCIPVYPRFLLTGDPGARLPAAAREINDAMPAHAARLLGDVRGRRVLILGVAYRGGVREIAFSGALALRTALVEHGAHVVASDPLYDDDALRELGFEPWDGGPVDAAVLQADHPEYRSLTAAGLPGVRVVVDGRSVLDPEAFAGVPVHRIGRPDAAARDGGSPIVPRPDTLGTRPG